MLQNIWFTRVQANSAYHQFISLSIKRTTRAYKDALEKHQFPFDAKLIGYCNHGGMIAEEVECSESILPRNRTYAVLLQAIE